LPQRVAKKKKKTLTKKKNKHGRGNFSADTKIREKGCCGKPRGLKGKAQRKKSPENLRKESLRKRTAVIRTSSCKRLTSLSKTQKTSSRNRLVVFNVESKKGDVELSGRNSGGGNKKKKQL